MQNTAFKTFYLVTKLEVPILALDRKPYLLANSTFGLVIRSEVLILTFDLVPKQELATFITRSKVLIIENQTLKTFDLVFKVVGTDFGIRSSNNGIFGF